MSGYEYYRSPEGSKAPTSTPQAARPVEQPYGNAAMMEDLRAAPESDGNDIEICTRVAELPVAYQLGLQHWWIRTPNMEAGMGPATGEVPAVDGDQGDLPFAATTVNDHSGQGDNHHSTCVPAEEWDEDWGNVDQVCVERASVLGSPTGPWTPLYNDCHDWVEVTMDSCDPDAQRYEHETESQRAQSYASQRYLERTHPGRY